MTTDAFGFTSGGDFLPRVKYNAQAGRVYRIDRRQDASGSWVSDEADITDTFAFAADLPSLKRGWADFDSQPPDILASPMDQPNPEQPSDRHRPYVRLRIQLSQECGGDLRDFGLASKAARSGFAAVYTQATQAPELEKGLTPVIRLTTVHRQKTGYGSSMVPVFEISQWIEPPEAFLAPETGSNGHETATNESQADNDDLPF